MFNPYNCRPIGSGHFYEHLKDIQTKQWYYTEFPECKTEAVSRLCESGHTPWYEKDPKEDPWTNLAWAIVILAMIDYLDAYEKKQEKSCMYLENTYFRCNSRTLEQIFNAMLFQVCWKGSNEIYQCRRKLMSVIGWVKRPDTIRKTREERAAEKQAAAEAEFRKLFAELESQYSEDDFGVLDLL